MGPHIEFGCPLGSSGFRDPLYGPPIDLQFLGMSLTTCHTTFSVIPSPQTVPERQTQRNNLPEVIWAAVNHTSRNCFTHSGTGTVRTCPPFPTRSMIAQRSSRR